MRDLELNTIELIYAGLALTLPYWFPVVMFTTGKSLIYKIKNPDIRLAVLAIYALFCFIFFIVGVKYLHL